MRGIGFCFFFVYIGGRYDELETSLYKWAEPYAHTSSCHGKFLEGGDSDWRERKTVRSRYLYNVTRTVFPFVSP